jgi:site-specific DNA recombinase
MASSGAEKRAVPSLFSGSGASLKVLDVLLAAIHAACAIPAPFEALVVDQLSRLTRDIGDTDAIVKKLTFFGIRIIAVQGGVDAAEETTKINFSVKSLVNEIYLDDLRETTKRGLDGQFLKGLSSGRRTYGFRSEPVYDTTGPTDLRGNPIPVGYRVCIEEGEAAILRKIFQLIA